MLVPTALELAEAKHVNQEEVIRHYDLWDDTGKSNEILTELANSAKAVDTLRDLKYKVLPPKSWNYLTYLTSIIISVFLCSIIYTGLLIMFRVLSLLGLVATE